MFNLVIAIHVIACALLIAIVLIQQGRGGGLIDSLSSAENIFGTKTSTFLVKTTSVLAVVFFFTCLSLAFLSIRKGKSLIETTYRPMAAAAAPATTKAPAPTSTKPAAPAAQTTTTAPVAQTSTTPTTATAQTTTTSPQGSPTPSANVETKK